MGQTISIEDIGSISLVNKSTKFYHIHLTNGEIVQKHIDNDFVVGRIKLAIGQKNDLNWSKEQQERGILENNKRNNIEIDSLTIDFSHYNQSSRAQVNLPQTTQTKSIPKISYLDDFAFISTLTHSHIEEFVKLIKQLSDRKITHNQFQSDWNKLINKFFNETRRDLNSYEKILKAKL